MPIYEYQCDTCKRVEEKWYATHAESQQREARPLPCAPNPKKCKGFLKRKVSAASFSVKGFNAQNGYTKGAV